MLISVIFDTVLFGGIIPAVYIAASRALDIEMGFFLYGHISLKIIGYSLISSGAVFIIWAYYMIVKIGGGYTLEFFNKEFLPVTKRLIRVGPYSRVRHPMVFGYLLSLAGISFASGSPSGILIIFPFVVIFTALYLVFFEERALRDRFKEEFETYSKTTPFLVPRFRKNTKGAGMP